jgi:hypothetical protein
MVVVFELLSVHDALTFTQQTNCTNNSTHLHIFFSHLQTAGSYAAIATVNPTNTIPTVLHQYKLS